MLERKKADRQSQLSNGSTNHRFGEVQKVTERPEDPARIAKSAMSVATAYQVKLLEITRSNTQFAFEYAQAMAAVRSPIDFMNVTSAFSKRRMELALQHSRELANLASLDV